jgi:pyruvate-ferredoxin/flavodoxin oxidoreductase
MRPASGKVKVFTMIGSHNSERDLQAAGAAGGGSGKEARRMVSIDGNTAVAHVAHATNEVIAIYPITPSSVMGEISDAKSAKGEKNIWGTIPSVTEMQSEGGASGACHGALTTGALTTTFTASQGLLLMIPNMFKIAGELTPTVFHVSARALAVQALSIFGDHSDVMATRSTGFGLIASGSVQECMDNALIAEAIALRSRIPFVHFFDGFRTSHEVAKVEELTFDDMRQMLPDELIFAHRSRALTPDNPLLRGSSQNPDVYFQGREVVNNYYTECINIAQQVMDQFATLTGRRYHLFDYYGAPDADRVVIMMGSGAECMHETIDHLNARGEKLGLIKVRIYRPFSVDALAKAIPASVKALCVLDRTKEPGCVGEPLYTDVQAALEEMVERKIAPFKAMPKITGGRYGLGSKEFTPATAKAVLDNLKQDAPKTHFTVGIVDDLAHTSLTVDQQFDIEGDDVFRGLFYGLGSDGTVGANKNSIKILGESGDWYAQGYFVYDSKKAGAVTVSHVRFGKHPIRSPYLISRANFVACHNFSFCEKYDMLTKLVQGGTFLLTSPYSAAEVWDHLPIEMQQGLIEKKANFYVIDAMSIAKDLGLGARINMIMQTAFFSITGLLPEEKTIGAIKKAIQKTYGSKGEKVVDMNNAAVDAATAGVHKVTYPATVTSKLARPPVVPADAPEFVRNVTAKIIEGKGDDLPVSAFPVDGSFMTGTTQYEKRNIAVDIPVWEPAACIQCNICSLVCPHAAIRPKVYNPSILGKAPKTFKSADAMTGPMKGLKYTLQVAPEDCTGCVVCVNACPAYMKDAAGKKTERKAINMALQSPLRESERENFNFFLEIPEPDTSLFSVATVKGSQFVTPLFEFSGACAGCGETPYVKLMSQMFGDRAVCGNATGCSSIYGGNLPTTPYTKRPDGRGPAWSNSLFEDNAEFGFGMRLTIDKMREFALELVAKLFPQRFDEFAKAPQTTPVEIEALRAKVEDIKKQLKGMNSPEARHLLSIADYLVKKSVWIIGGDGWAYDIGFGGLDHVLASGKNINLLVLDTEVYSNTGGQMSKSTPRGAVALFAAGGKPAPKKDLGLEMMSYGNIYIARVAMGASANQTVKAFAEAEAFDGPSLIIAYSHCIAHGIDISIGLTEQEKAVNSGHWILFRYNPDLAKQGKNPLLLDCKDPSISYEEYAYGENRFRALRADNPEKAKESIALAQAEATARFRYYKQLSELPWGNGK